MTTREAQQLHLIEQWLKLSPSQREIKRALVRARAVCPLAHRGEWRIPDTHAEPPDLSDVEPTIEHLGSWGTTCRRAS